MTGKGPSSFNYLEGGLQFQLFLVHSSYPKFLSFKCFKGTCTCCSERGKKESEENKTRAHHVSLHSAGIPIGSHVLKYPDCKLDTAPHLSLAL
jgi:hypothetical protein